MMHDGETSKPKRYGIIEYPDINSAEMSIRYLKGYDSVNNLALCVDSVADEPAPLKDNLYGPEYDAGNAPDGILQTTASLAPEKSSTW